MDDREATTEALRGDLANLPCFLLYVGWRRAQLVYKPLLEGQSPQRMYLLHLLHQHRELGVTAIARALDLDVGSVSGLLGRMESEGLLERNRSGRNRLEVRVTLTTSGRRVYRRLAGAIEEFDGELLAALGERDRLGLSRIVDHLEKLTDGT